MSQDLEDAVRRVCGGLYDQIDCGAYDVKYPHVVTMPSVVWDSKLPASKLKEVHYSDVVLDQLYQLLDVEPGSDIVQEVANLLDDLAQVREQADDSYDELHALKLKALQDVEAVKAQNATLKSPFSDYISYHYDPFTNKVLFTKHEGGVSPYDPKSTVTAALTKEYPSVKVPRITTDRPMKSWTGPKLVSNV